MISNTGYFVAKLHIWIEKTKLFQKKVYLCTMNEQKRQDNR